MSQHISTLHDVRAALERSADAFATFAEYYSNKTTQALEKELPMAQKMVETFPHMPQVVAHRKMIVELIEAELAKRKGGAAQ